MARGINKVILIGNLGQDPDVRYMPNGGAVVNCSLATSNSWRNRETGEMHEKTEWHRLVMFGRLAEVAGEYLRKGSKTYIEGRLQTKQWEREGQKHYTTEVVVEEMQMLDSRGSYERSEGQRQAPEESAAPRSNQPGNSREESSPEFDDDIPF